MMCHVILPQAVRNIIPSLVTQFIVLFKDTSLASIIGMMDLTKGAQTVSQRELRPFEMYLFIAVVYWRHLYLQHVPFQPMARSQDVSRKEALTLSANPKLQIPNQK